MSAAEPKSEAVSFRAADGQSLGGTLYRPGATPRAFVLLHPATAVPQRLYQPLAAELAAQGFLALSYDYRGIGSSAPRDLRDCKARMRDWMMLDVTAATDWARGQFPALPLLAVGHSVGGHALGLSDATRHLTAAALIASHAGYIGSVAGFAERQRVRLMLRGIGPLATRLAGYMPGSRLGLGEDLPAGVFLEWSDWCAQPGYFFDDASLDAASRYARVRLPLLALGFSDDPWANPRAIDALLRHYTQARIERRQYAPADAAGLAIGHMGFYRRAHQKTLWPKLIDWLSAQLDAQRAAA